MTDRTEWTRKQLLVAFSLYCQIPFGKMHSRNPEIIRYAQLIGRTPSALAMKLTNIASLDPVITKSGRKGLSGASIADKKMWQEMQENWQQFAMQSEAALDDLGIITTDNVLDKESASENDIDYQGGSKKALVEIRIGQQFFRKAILSAYEFRCCISGLAVPSLLIASHIVPWRSDLKNRLNPKNGLCLSVLHDRAFDLGLITISTEYTVQASGRLSKTKDGFLQTSLLKYADERIQLPDKFQPDELFLEYHRKNIFQAA